MTQTAPPSLDIGRVRIGWASDHTIAFRSFVEWPHHRALLAQACLLAIQDDAKMVEGVFAKLDRPVDSSHHRRR